MLKRDVDRELAMHDIGESSALNALILLTVLKYMPICSLNQLARAFYLVRFTNVLSKLLTDDEREHFLSGVNEWELGNLDTLLSPYIIQKYDQRFIRGIKELFARNLISVVGESVVQTRIVNLDVEDSNFARLNHKAYYASATVMNSEISKLDKQINTIVGEEQWQILYSSTELQ